MGSNPAKRRSFHNRIFSSSQDIQYLRADHTIHFCKNDQLEISKQISNSYFIMALNHVIHTKSGKLSPNHKLIASLPGRFLLPIRTLRHPTEHRTNIQIKPCHANIFGHRRHHPRRWSLLPGAIYDNHPTGVSSRNQFPVAESFHVLRSEYKLDRSIGIM